ncbi:MAG: D-alanine--D-alanine ligase [Pseudomonadota bacterium]
MSATREFGRIAVLYGGHSGERDVSLTSGRAVASALQSVGVDAVLFDPAAMPLEDLKAQGFAACWNALHGGAGEDGTVQGALETLGIPYTGSGVLGSALAMDKQRAKAVLAAAGIPVPAGIVLVAGDDLPPLPSLPVFVKPVASGSSLGNTPVHTQAALPAAVAAALTHDSRALIEPLLSGPEMTVGVVGDLALPAIRIEAGNAFYDYDAKYTSSDTRFQCPGTDDAALAKQLETLALRSFRALDCRGWGRVDFMLDESGEPFVLEVNTVPGMTSHSLVPHAAGVAGWTFADLCVRILELGVHAAKKEAA